MKGVVLVLLLSATVAACKAKSKTEESAPAPPAAPGAAPAQASTAPAGPVALGDLGLKADLPPGASVGEGIGGGVMVTGVAGAAMTVAVASDMNPATLEDAQKEIEMYTPANVKTETLADGWALTFENSGSAGANYWVMVRREIGGQAYRCETTASTTEQQQAVLAACKSLKP